MPKPTCTTSSSSNESFMSTLPFDEVCLFPCFIVSCWSGCSPGVLQVAVNTEDAALSPGLASAVTALALDTTAPPAIAVSTTPARGLAQLRNTDSLIIKALEITVCSCVLDVFFQPCTKRRVRPTNTAAPRWDISTSTWTAADPSDLSWFTATWQVTPADLWPLPQLYY